MVRQTVTRKAEFDAGHRVMNERMKCFNVHGHRYVAELTFDFENMEEIGYAIDFKEIKRVAATWIDDQMDHGMILNPEDRKLIETVQSLGTKTWIMSLNGNAYCNPSVENIAKEIFIAIDHMFSWLYKDSETGLRLFKIKLFETPNCWTEVTRETLRASEISNFLERRQLELEQYAQEKGRVEYDDRKINE